MSAIHSDAPIETTTGSLDEGADAFLELWKKDAAEPSDTKGKDEREDTTPEQAETEEEADEPTDEETDGEDEGDEETVEEGDDEEGDEADKKVLKDTSVVKIKVDGEELAVPVEKLKRLYGQEAALTRKSQEVAAARKQLEDSGARHVASAEALLNRAQERFKPYAGIDWLVASRQLEPEEFKYLRSEAQKAHDDVQFLEKELDGYMEKVREERNGNLLTEARKTFEELSKPDTGIKGFNEALYNDMRAFAISQGVPEDFVNNTVSAPLLRMLHKAMMFDKGQKVVTKTSDKRPKKIIKSKTTSESTKSAFSNRPQSRALDKLKSSGSMDDAANAFLAGWSE